MKREKKHTDHITEISVFRTHSIYGAVALIFGIIAFFFMFIPGTLTPDFFVRITIHSTLGILAMIFGVYAYWGKNRRDNWGLTGFGLGVFAVIIVILSYIIWTNVSY